MRVIAGKARRLLLVSPEGKNTRPTTDRIKETLFNMLQNDVYGSKFLDLFSGCGGIGIEALSRGEACDFCRIRQKGALVYPNEFGEDEISRTVNGAADGSYLCHIQTGKAGPLF